MTAPQRQLPIQELIACARFWAAEIGAVGSMQLQIAVLPGRAAQSLLGEPGGGPAMDPSTSRGVARIVGTFAQSTEPGESGGTAAHAVASVLLLLDPNTGLVTGSRASFAARDAVPAITSAQGARIDPASVITLTTTPLTEMPAVIAASGAVAPRG